MIGSKVTVIFMTKRVFLKGHFFTICISLWAQKPIKIIKIIVTKAKWYQYFQFYLKRGLKWPSRKKVFFLFCCWSFLTILLCIVGELAEGGSVAVAVGVNDNVTCDI